MLAAALFTVKDAEATSVPDQGEVARAGKGVSLGHEKGTKSHHVTAQMALEGTVRSGPPQTKTNAT